MPRQLICIITPPALFLLMRLCLSPTIFATAPPQPVDSSSSITPSPCLGEHRQDCFVVGTKAYMLQSDDTESPEMVTLIAPMDGATVPEGQIFLQWHPPLDTPADTILTSGLYRVIVSHQADMSAPLISRAFSVRACTSPELHDPVGHSLSLANGVYYWRVQAADRAGNWSNLWNTAHPPHELVVMDTITGAVLADDLLITQSITMEPGFYQVQDPQLDGVIKISGEEITLDGRGVILDGMNFEGYGIWITDAVSVTLRNFDIRHFQYGIRVEDSTDVTIENSVISGNRKDTTTSWLDINISAPHYGGGILFNRVTSSTIQNNILTDQSIGAELFDSHYNTVISNVISYGAAADETLHNSCWSIRLYGSTHNLLQNNLADYVARRRYGLVDGDAAGILLVVGAHENRLIANSFTHSGDGFFIGNEWGAPSNFNYLRGNDGSYAWANAFETTFSEGNIFEDNRATHSNYGFWLGYSYNSQLCGNEISDNYQVGVAVEHGYNNYLLGNVIARNSYGISLWWDYDSWLPPQPSQDYFIAENEIHHNLYGIEIDATDHVTLTRNLLEDNTYGFWAGPTASMEISLTQNNLLCQNSNATIPDLTYGKVVERDVVVRKDRETVLWQVDLGKVYTVSEMVLSPPADFALRFRLDISQDGLFTGEQLTILQEEQRPYLPRISYEFAPVAARYLRLVGNSSVGVSQLPKVAIFATAGHHSPACSYLVYNDMPSTNTVNAPRNWWGSTITAQITALIYDQYDDASKGSVKYTPFLSTAITHPTTEHSLYLPVMLKDNS